MFSRLFQYCSRIYYTIMYKLGRCSVEETNLLRIYVKTNKGTVIPLDLDPSWDIQHVKNITAPKLGMSPSEIKIILAGKELHNSTTIEKCDLGQYSILHAACISGVKPKSSLETLGEAERERHPLNTSDEKGSEPMCETIMDLQLTDEERLIIDSADTKRAKAQFFIYCNSPCKSLRKGKLRVQCHKCAEGAFTVSRDPYCWDDVLLPCQIEGVCTTEECDGCFAYFYFKCAEHVSQGESDKTIALHMIKSNFKDVPCLACADVADPILVFGCESTHVMCLDCFQMYCTTRLNDRQFVQDEDRGYTLPCPAGCPNSLIDEVHHFRLLGEVLYEKYQKFGTEEYLFQAGGLLCPQPDCGMGLLPDPDCRRVQCKNGCGYVFCRQCLQGFHLGECEDVNRNLQTNPSLSYVVDPDRASQAKWDEASRVKIKISTKPCPKCRIPTERDGGCMHMVCTRPQCSFHWCWVCQTEWNRECMGNHWFG